MKLRFAALAVIAAAGWFGPTAIAGAAGVRGSQPQPTVRKALAVRRAYDRFAYQALFGSARVACSLLGEGDIARYLKTPVQQRGLIDAKNCVDGVTTLRRQTLSVRTNHCDGFTPRFLDGNLSYAQHYLVATYESADVVRLHAGPEVFFADENQTQVWTRTHGRWILTSGPPPVFEPQC